MEHPKLRQIEAIPINYSGREMIALRDPSQTTDKTIVVPEEIFYILQFFDGQHSLLDIRSEFMRRFGTFLYEDQLKELINSLDQNLFLDSDRYQEYEQRRIRNYRNQPVRAAAFAGQSYQAGAEALSNQISDFFTSPTGPGLPDGKLQSLQLKGLVAPHIDIKAGGTCFAHAYKELAESQDIDLFIIIGTGHAGVKNFFACTDKVFETPLGRVSVDKAFLAQLQQKLDIDIYEQDVLHQTEHTLEFQVIFLQWVYLSKHDFMIVPILSNFAAQMFDPDWSEPTHPKMIREFLNALKETIQQTEKRVCVIASADLAHVGPRYGDTFKPDNIFLADLGIKDKETLGFVAGLDSESFRESVRKDDVERRICGFPPIYSMLEVMGASEGRLLKYDHVAVDPYQSTVSFASMAFY